jgi:hypothetical protein
MGKSWENMTKYPTTRGFNGKTHYQGALKWKNGDTTDKR